MIHNSVFNIHIITKVHKILNFIFNYQDKFHSLINLLYSKNKLFALEVPPPHFRIIKN